MALLHLSFSFLVFVLPGFYVVFKILQKLKRSWRRPNRDFFLGKLLINRDNDCRHRREQANEWRDGLFCQIVLHIRLCAFILRINMIGMDMFRRWRDWSVHFPQKGWVTSLLQGDSTMKMWQPPSQCSFYFHPDIMVSDTLMDGMFHRHDSHHILFPLSFQVQHCSCCVMTAVTHHMSG